MSACHCGLVLKSCRERVWQQAWQSAQYNLNNIVTNVLPAPSGDELCSVCSRDGKEGKCLFGTIWFVVTGSKHDSPNNQRNIILGPKIPWAPSAISTTSSSCQQIGFCIMVKFYGIAIRGLSASETNPGTNSHVLWSPQRLVREYWRTNNIRRTNNHSRQIRKKVGEN